MIRIYQANPPWLSDIVGWYIIHLDQHGDDQLAINELRKASRSVRWVIQGEGGSHYEPAPSSMKLRLSRMFSGRPDVARLLPEHTWPNLKHNGDPADDNQVRRFDEMSLNPS